VEAFAWRAGFPLSVTGGRWWVAALGGPADNVERYAYRPEWFRYSALMHMGAMAKKGPMLWASHSCYVHGPLHLSLREAMSLPNWWKRSPRALEGSGNPFTDASTGGQDDVARVRVASARREMARWLRALDEQSVLGNALVIVLSDHGPRGEWVPRERTEHIQLAAFAPGPRREAFVHAPVSLVDIAPTIRQHLRLPVGSGAGISLLDGADVRPPRRLLGRVVAASLDSAGIKLDQVSANDVSRTIAFNGDGTYTFSPDFVRDVALSTARQAGGRDTMHVLQFVDWNGRPDPMGSPH
jgi:hypothetical protein